MKMCGPFKTVRQTAAVLAATAVCGYGNDATAQSRFACEFLDGGTVPVVEGEDGMFFRIETDLLTDTRITEPVVAQIATLSKALESRGTELVVIPIPTKGLLFPDALGEGAKVYGFEPGLARGLYDDTLFRLGAAGVTQVDALTALSRSVEPPMFRTDPRLTNAGIRELAFATAREFAPPVASPRFSATERGTVTVPSVLHQQIQSRCLVTLSAPETVSFDTVSLTNSGLGQDVILIESGMMAGTGLSPAGLFAAALGRPVNHTSFGKVPLGGLLTVLASEAFQHAPPAALIWVLPITEDLARYGSRPMIEATGFAKNACRVDLIGRTDGDTVAIDLSQASPDLGIMMSLGEQTSETVSVTMRQEDGSARRRSIVRGKGAGTSRFLMPLAAGVTNVEIKVPGGFDTAPTLSLCEV